MAVDRQPLVVPSAFTGRGHRLAYTEFGEGKRWVLLMPGLLIPALMQEPLAHGAGRERGARARRSTRWATVTPTARSDMAEYSIESFAGDAIALLDHLDIDEAVIGGTSLGANVTLEIAHAAPHRVRGMIIEMPVLENALVASVIAFGPLLVALHFGERLMRPVAAALRRIPRRLVPFWGNVALDVVRQDPGRAPRCSRGCSSATSPRTARSAGELTMPALVIGHHIDPVHPFSDAGVLTERASRTHASSRRRTSSSCGSGPSASPRRSRHSSRSAGRRGRSRSLAASAAAPPDARLVADDVARPLPHAPVS